TGQPRGRPGARDGLLRGLPVGRGHRPHLALHRGGLAHHHRAGGRHRRRRLGGGDPRPGRAALRRPGGAAMNDPWVQALGRGRWLESLLAVGGAVAVSWPLGDLVAHRPWTAPLVGLLLLVVVVGSALRTARAPRPLVLVAQVLALLLGLSWCHSVQCPEDRPGYLA